ncbi:MAG: TetR family transcriptional regulator [Actinomycetota bacterium]|jgi:AcrR family transcriptional regulator|nr:TetR family transcriptional regulator [Actinomycetota bacterium]
MTLDEPPVAPGPAAAAPGAGCITMSQLVERTGVPAATVRYYRSAGLLPPPVKVAANRYLYDERHVELVRLVRLLRDRRQLSIDAIARLLPDLLPDLLGRPGSGVFRADMWSPARSLSAYDEPPAGPSVGERVLQAGLLHFAEQGYADVSIEDVCRSAGIAKGSFYRHFASKEHLFFAVAAAAGTDAADELGKAPGGPLDEAAATGALAEAVAPYLGIVLDLAALAARRRPGHAPVLRALTAQLRDAVAARLAPGASPEAVVDRALARGLRGCAAG